MKHRHYKSHKLMYRVLLAILSIIIIGFGGLYVFNQHKQISDSNVSSSNFEPGEISISFKDGVTFQQAKELINSYNLVLDQPDSVYIDSFTPWDYRAVKTSQFDQIRNNLKNYPEVTSFADANSDGTSRAGPGYTWVKVTFSQDATMSRIVTILKTSGLGLGETPDHPIIVNRTISPKVPAGQENTYINKFKQKPIVQSAGRIGYPIPI